MENIDSQLETLVATLYAEGYQLEEILDIIAKKYPNNKFDNVKKALDIYGKYIKKVPEKPDVLCSSYDLDDIKQK